MISPDYTDRVYTAEVLRTSGRGASAFEVAGKLMQDPRTVEDITEFDGALVKVMHGFWCSSTPYHRVSRTRTLSSGRRLELPRQTNGKFLYDFLVAQSGRHLVIAVPFHALAEEVFLRVDERLAGKGAVYHKLDITRMVMQLGQRRLGEGISGDAGPSKDPPERCSLSVSRCHLTYAYPMKTFGPVQCIRLSGNDLGASEEYARLIGPILDPSLHVATVTPVVLGFSLIVNGVRKTSAVTDRHGNFKLTIAPGARRLTRAFSLLAALTEMDGVMSSTNDIPILQSASIKDVSE